MRSDPTRRRTIRAPQDLAAGLSLVALSAFGLWASSPLDQGTLRAIGPGLMPRAVAILILVIGLALAAWALLRDGEPLARWSLRGPLYITAGVVAFALTIRSPGLVVAGPLVSLVTGAASPDARVKELAIFGAALTAFCVLLFRYALHLPIPILVIPGVVVL
ncbi:MAG: tripartite tricarboxylate transporter TctB family protein [Anaeromyxobacteraceae bacterium]